MDDLNEQHRRCLNEFSNLLNTSNKFFNRIRELPRYGASQWQALFARTFDVFTKLWRFQQQHRQILDVKFGLQRWQIGEIASKIGQLYYHYYLRTSDICYLLEAFSFYSAIRARGYYSSVNDIASTRPDLVIKKLRYCTRFIVVCLLLKKLKLVRDMVKELSHHVHDYMEQFEPDDQLEWALILTEIRSFVEADNIISIMDTGNSTVILSHRLSFYNSPPLVHCIQSQLSLQEAIIVGNRVEQVTFTELSLDMFWMIQALEREPNRSDESSDSIGNGNPHKYLLHKPTFWQLMLFLNSGYKELPENGVLLLYLSMNGFFPKHTVRKIEGIETNYFVGGLAMDNGIQHGSIKRPLNSRSKINQNYSSTRTACETNCLYPADLVPMLRKPTFLIVDSENANVFLQIPSLFGQPLVILISPVDLPDFLKDSSHLDFFSDDYLRLLTLRFVFCCFTLSLHRSFRGNPTFQPNSRPPIADEELIVDENLRNLIGELVDILEVAYFFPNQQDETIC